MFFFIFHVYKVSVSMKTLTAIHVNCLRFDLDGVII